MHFANHTQQHGAGGAPLAIYLILYLHCYISLMLCIYLIKFLLILPQMHFHYNLRSFIVNQTSL